MREIDVPMGNGLVFRITLDETRGAEFDGMIDHVTATASLITNNQNRIFCCIDCTHGAGHIWNDLTVTTYEHRDGSVLTNTVQPFLQYYVDIIADQDGGYSLNVVNSSTDQPVDMFCDSGFPTLEAARLMRDAMIQQHPEIVWTDGIEHQPDDCWWMHEGKGTNRTGLTFLLDGCELVC